MATSELSEGKACRRCGEWKPLEAYHKQPNMPTGRHSWCAACYNAWAKAKRQRNDTPEQKRRWLLMTRYGMTEAQFEEMLTIQKHACAICGTPLPTVRSTRIDHCHETGKIRGLLCHHCNIRLQVVEDEEFLKAASAYLSRSIFWSAGSLVNRRVLPGNGGVRTMIAGSGPSL